jgi:hypothetical protein
MTALGHKRRFDRQPLTSGVPRSTDIPGRSRHVAKVPRRDICAQTPVELACLLLAGRWAYFYLRLPVT